MGGEAQPKDQRETGVRLLRWGVIVVCTLGLVLVNLLLYRAGRVVTLELSGEAGRTCLVKVLHDGELFEDAAVVLPATLTFTARDLAYQVVPADGVAGGAITGKITTDDGFADASSTGWGVQGAVNCTNLLGLWAGDLMVSTMAEGAPLPPMPEL